MGLLVLNMASSIADEESVSSWGNFTLTPTLSRRGRGDDMGFSLPSRVDKTLREGVRGRGMCLFEVRWGHLTSTVTIKYVGAFYRLTSLLPFDKLV